MDTDREESGSRFAYVRAFLTVAVFYGLALVYDFLAGSDLFGVGAGRAADNPVAWPMLLALWWMAILHWPLLFFFYWKGVRVNRYFSNEAVFRTVFTAWYGGIAGLVILAAALGLPYGWLVAAGFLLAVIAGGRGFRLWRLADYGSTCVSLLVFHWACLDVPPAWRIECYVGIGVVQSIFLAVLELVFQDAFLPPDAAGPLTMEASAGAKDAGSPPEAPVPPEGEL